MSRLLRTSTFALFFSLTFNTAQSQTTYTWNYAGTDWNTAANWSPSGGPPTATDIAILNFSSLNTFAIPSLSANSAVGQYIIQGPRGLSVNTVSGNGNTLTIGTGGAMSQSPMIFRGTFGTTTTWDNFRINVAAGTSFVPGSQADTVGAIELSGQTNRILLQNNSQFQLSNAAGTVNYDLTISSAQVQLQTGAQITNGIGNSATQGRIQFQGGGTFAVVGANATISTAATTTYNINQIAIQSGLSTINVNAGTNNGSNLAKVILNIGNGSLQSGIDRIIRSSSGAVLGTGSGTVLFAANDIMPGFTGYRSSIFLAPGASGISSQNGVITEGSSANSNTPYVILTGTISGVSSTATRFAQINSVTNEVTAQQGTSRTETTLTSAAANENTIYRPTTTSANATLSNSISTQTVVFEPRTSAQSVDLNGNTLTTNGIALSGIAGTSSNPAVFNINGGTLAGSAAADRTFFIANGNSILNISSNFAGSSNGSIIKSGSGLLSLTGTTDQMAFSGITDVVINSGSLRARTSGANLNFGTTNNDIQFRGGVLEIDASGGTTNFTRSLGINAGQVNWTGGVSSELRQDRGNGGFAAINGVVNVNIGGAGQTLTWNGTGTDRFFLRSGNSLTLGSTAQNNILNFQNPIALDNGLATAPIESRAIYAFQQTPNTPSSRSQLSGVISGGPNSSLVLTGTGTIELLAANTHSGGTIVDTATVVISNTTGSATGTGPVTVTRGILIGNGTIAPSAGNGVTVAGPSGVNGLLITDSQFGTAGHMKIGTDGVNNPVTFLPGSVFGSRISGNTFDPNGGATSYGRLMVKGTGTITVSDAIFSFGLSNTFTPNTGDTFGIIDNQTSNAISGFFNGIAQDAMVTITRADNSTAGTVQVSYTGNIALDGTVTATGGNDLVIYNFVPVPEPTTILGITTILGGLVYRLRRKQSHAVTSA